MNITLSPRFEAMIRARIEHGDYADAADVVEEALLRMEQEDQAKLERLRAALQLGLDDVANGRGREYTPEVRAEILANARRKIREGHQPDPEVIP
jgi:antitoxin ParD1/3/4